MGAVIASNTDNICAMMMADCLQTCHTGACLQSWLLFCGHHWTENNTSSNTGWQVEDLWVARLNWFWTLHVDNFILSALTKYELGNYRMRWQSKKRLKSCKLVVTVLLIILSTCCSIHCHDRQTLWLYLSLTTRWLCPWTLEWRVRM